ncbi:FixH family protein [Aestuariivirga sp.]|uniref:FixH family protein n=1 Tax=Aestuariivirga sp. TaxID=2650926 RepID=UPI0025B88DA4|nr:FixH family protein [Aestuariivirga sp.]MCA3555534.1 FixH family protein [Aestuariivirga sp.]
MSMASVERELKGHHVLAMIIAFFGVIFGVNFLMAYLAESTWSGLVVENGYVASQTFNSDLARARAQEALGWKVDFTHDQDSVMVSFTDARGAKIDTLNLTGRLQRTVTDKEDQVLTFAWLGSGLYAAPARLKPGLWEVEVDGKGEGVADYRKIFRFVVKAE